MQNQRLLISATLLQWETGSAFCARAYGAQNRDPKPPRASHVLGRTCQRDEGKTHTLNEKESSWVSLFFQYCPFEVSIGEREGEIKEGARTLLWQDFTGERAQDLDPKSLRWSRHWGLAMLLHTSCGISYSIDLQGLNRKKDGWEWIFQALKHNTDTRPLGDAASREGCTRSSWGPRLTAWQGPHPGRGGKCVYVYVHVYLCICAYISICSYIRSHLMTTQYDQAPC